MTAIEIPITLTLPESRVDVRSMYCDNPSCVRPSHLQPGTNAQNSEDMVARGRSLKGALNHKAKLTPRQVEEIRKVCRARLLPQWQIAILCGVKEITISEISAGRTWEQE